MSSRANGSNPSPFHSFRGALNEFNQGGGSENPLKKFKILSENSIFLNIIICFIDCHKIDFLNLINQTLLI
jgi:hypothetical protein